MYVKTFKTCVITNVFSRGCRGRDRDVVSLNLDQGEVYNIM